MALFCDRRYVNTRSEFRHSLCQFIPPYGLIGLLQYPADHQSVNCSLPTCPHHTAVCSPQMKSYNALTLPMQYLTALPPLPALIHRRSHPRSLLLLLHLPLPRHFYRLATPHIQRYLTASSAPTSPAWGESSAVQCTAMPI